MKRRRTKKNPVTGPLVGGVVLGLFVPALAAVLLAKGSSLRLQLGLSVVAAGVGFGLGPPGSLLRGVGYGGAVNALAGGFLITVGAPSAVAAVAPSNAAPSIAPAQAPGV